MLVNGSAGCTESQLQMETGVKGGGTRERALGSDRGCPGGRGGNVWQEVRGSKHFPVSENQGGNEASGQMGKHLLSRVAKRGPGDSPGTEGSRPCGAGSSVGTG